MASDSPLPAFFRPRRSFPKRSGVRSTLIMRLRLRRNHSRRQTNPPLNLVCRYFACGCCGRPRATHTTVADLNGDGRDDLIVCGFGNSLGNLFWFENQGEGNYSEHVLLSGAGAIQTFVHDWDGDGRLDVALLRGQAREGVEIFYNRGTRFEEVPVIQLPSSYGCASWQVLDFDGDGHLDLLIANGDNGDYKSKPKAYHGLRLYRGDGHGHFTERWFYPLNGAYGFYAADFDGDGDLDIAAISYFPDYEKYPDESFVYLRYDGDWHFQPFVLPEARQ